MERRLTHRKRADTKVFLHHPELPATPCITRDLSPGGVFVLTPHAVRIPIHTTLEMTFAVDLGRVTRLYEFEVTVVRCTPEGLGLAIERARPARSRAGPHRVEARHPANVMPLRGRS